MKILSIVLILPFLCLGSILFASDVAVVVSKDTPVEHLEAGELLQLFLGKEVLWNNGKRVILAVLLSGKTHNQFLEQVVHKTDSQYKMIWKRVVFTGKGIPPKVFKEESKLAEFVAATQGAIGYIADDLVHASNGLKIVYP